MRDFGFRTARAVLAKVLHSAGHVYLYCMFVCHPFTLQYLYVIHFFYVPVLWPTCFFCVCIDWLILFVSVVCCAGRVHPMPALCRGAIMSGRGAADWQARSQDNAIRKTGLLLTTPTPTPPPPTVICCFSRFSLLILNLVSLLQAINALNVFLTRRKKKYMFYGFIITPENLS